MAATWPASWCVPDWPVPAQVHAFVTTRAGGVSQGPWGLADNSPGGMNLGTMSEDAPAAVAANRARLRALLPGEPHWLRQVHGATVVAAPLARERPDADAVYTVQPDVVCAVLVADCMPVFIADARGRGVAVAHAGWRGLAAGVLQATVAALRTALAAPSARLLAWCGPAIGPAHFEVGAEVREAMRAHLPDADAGFRPAGVPGKFFADLPVLARQALAQARVDWIGGTADCTYADPSRYYSFRRDRVTGRHAAVIWRSDTASPV